jgi:hypothetical protein
MKLTSMKRWAAQTLQARGRTRVEGKNMFGSAVMRVVMTFVLVVPLLALVTPTSRAANLAQAGAWAFPNRGFRVPITVNPGTFARTDKTAEIQLNFAQLVGSGNTFVPSSLAVAEVDAAGAVIDNNVVFQFDDPDTNGDGRLIFLMKGTTAAGAERRFQVYFSASGSFTAPTFADRVVVTDEPNYEGQASFKIETKDADGTTTNTTFQYHKQGGGFAAMIDRQGNDWIGYAPGNRSFRGILSGTELGQPGATGGSSTKESDGPLKTTIRTKNPGDQTNSNEYIWEIYPNYATLTVVRLRTSNGKPVPYWFSYTGSAGAAIEPQDNIIFGNEKTKDTTPGSVLSDTIKPEWAAFRDAATTRSLFLASSLNDGIGDTYNRQENSGPSAATPKVPAVVMVFGRPNAGASPRLIATNAKFTIGFAETKDFPQLSGTTNNAYQGLTVNAGNVEQRQNQPPTAVNDTASTTPGTPVTIDVTANDTDADNDTLVPAVVTQPANGTVGAGTGNTLVYTPTANFTGTDTFTYRVSDGAAQSQPATVTITVSQQAATVVATNDTAGVAPGQSVTISVLSNDTVPAGATATVTVVTQPTNGKVEPGQNNTLVYTPNQGFTGTDTFTYRITVGSTSSAPATVTVNVAAGAGGGRVFLPLTVR